MKRYLAFFGGVAAILLILGLNSACQSSGTPRAAVPEATEAGIAKSGAKLEHATFALGCFWHSEEICLEIKGVKDAAPGYSGGKEPNPDYETVGSGNTRYAESVDITYDPSIISYGKLLQVLFTEHDPTTPDMQYPDHGPQYRSVIFYRDASQQKQAEDYIALLAARKTFGAPIVTEVVPFTKFYQAEDYHLRYWRHHKNDGGYITSVTGAEIEKFRKDFPDLVK
jgi:peptide-methionine (S)-S-oxide reductase